MASITPYPSGSDIIAPLPLYTPDFGMMNSMMQRRSAMFEQGLSQVKSSDSLIRNAALSVSDNLIVRDQYIKQAEAQLQKLQGADFSQMQNVQSAQQVYAPFWQDQELLLDYSKTSSINAERTRAESLAQSNDPKQRELYWQDGLNYVNLSANELSMAKRGDGSISKVKVNKYVPYFDVMGELQKRAKDQGLVIEEDKLDPTGKYKITRTNGNAAVPVFREWASRELSTMPQATDIFRVQGVVRHQSRLQQYKQMGYDESSARMALANQYMTEQKNHYDDRYSEIDGQVVTTKAELDKIVAENDAKGDKLTQEDIAKFVEKQKMYEALVNTRKSYEGEVNKYRDSNSKEYQDIYNSILNNGEQFFAEAGRDNMINNFARTEAIKTKVKYTVDDGYKLQMEIQKEFAKLQQDSDQFQTRYGGGLLGGGVGGSGTGSGGKMTEKEKEAANAIAQGAPTGNPNDVPVPMGLNVKGTDPVAAQVRMVANKERLLNQVMNTQSSIITKANMIDPSGVKVSPKLVTALQTAVKTGKMTTDPEILDEYKILQDANVIPKSYKFNTAPNQVLGLLYDRATNIHTVNGQQLPSTAGTFSQIASMEKASRSYYELDKLHKEADKIILKDPVLKTLYKNGKMQSEEEYLKNLFGVTNENDLLAKKPAKDKSFGYMSIGAASTTNVNAAELANFKEAKEEYKRLHTAAMTKMSTIMGRYIDEEGAYIGPSIFLRTDRKDDQEMSQTMAMQATSDDNLRNQIVDKNGVAPVNIKQLVDQGADDDDVRKILQTFKGPAMANVIDGVMVNKVGSNGKASVVVKFNLEELKKQLGKDEAEAMAKTITVLNNGMEFNVDQTLISGFNGQFDVNSIDAMALDKYDMVSAPEIYKKFGFDYIIQRDKAAGEYQVKITFPVAGQEKGSQHFSVPINSTLATIQNHIDNKVTQIYTLNQRALQQQGGSGNFTNTSPGNIAEAWKAQKKLYTQQ